MSPTSYTADSSPLLINLELGHGQPPPEPTNTSTHFHPAHLNRDRHWERTDARAGRDEWYCGTAPFRARVGGHREQRGGQGVGEFGSHLSAVWERAWMIVSMKNRRVSWHRREDNEIGGIRERWMVSEGGRTTDLVRTWAGGLQR
jgi:hypothetical protein